MADIEPARIETPVDSPEFLAEMENILAMVRRLLRYRPATLASTLHGQKSLEFVEYTPYAAGDDLRRVDWNVYRRLHQVMVKKYAVELPTHWAVGVDMSASMSLYGKLSFACRLAAVILYLGVSLVDSVSLFLFPGNDRVWRYRRRDDVRQGLSLLNNRTPAGKQVSFRQIGAQLARRTHVMLISDFYGPLAQEWLPLARLKDMRGTALHIVADEERSPAWQGLFVLQDAESGARRQLTITPAMLAQYRRRFAEHLARLKTGCLERQIAYQSIATGESLDRVVLQTLRCLGLLR